ncbi:MAG TPA: hypothetical protein DCQ28_09270, partial [Bacteroidetes bacterium]|nr:hypothetical protein [Bacteroidota bacterium]
MLKGFNPPSDKNFWKNNNSNVNYWINIEFHSINETFTITVLSFEALIHFLKFIVFSVIIIYISSYSLIMVAKNVQNIKENIGKICLEIGRNAVDIKLIAVSKTF